MSDAVGVAVAKAVTAMISAAALATKPDVIERSYADWTIELKSACGPRIDVVLVTTEQKRSQASRGSSKFILPVDIAIRQKFSSNNRDDDTHRVDIGQIDALLLLTEQIEDLFEAVSLTEYTEATWIETKPIVVADKELLRTKAQFTAVLRLVFEVMKDHP